MRKSWELNDRLRCDVLDFLRAHDLADAIRSRDVVAAMRGRGYRDSDWTGDGGIYRAVDRALQFHRRAKQAKHSRASGWSVA